MYIQIISLTFDIVIAAGFLFFGLGPLTDPVTWKYKPALYEAGITTILGFVLLAVGILDFFV